MKGLTGAERGEIPLRRGKVPKPKDLQPAGREVVVVTKAAAQRGKRMCVCVACGLGDSKGRKEGSCEREEENRGQERGAPHNCAGKWADRELATCGVWCTGCVMIG